jgi:hypothetical protein
MTEVRMQGVGDPHRHELPEAREKKMSPERAHAERLESERQARERESEPDAPLKKRE